MSSNLVEIRGYLLHITHYDPVWCRDKEKEKPFDLGVGLDVIDTAADAGLNLLLLDVKDGVIYDSHPDLKRPYSQPKTILEELRNRAEKRGMEIAIKLNFSQSPLHKHNDWFRPYNDLFDSDEYWAKAFEIVDELIAVLKPRRFFHIGMDEDHSRSIRQYVAAVATLREGLARRGLRTLIWNDSACRWPAAEGHREKSLAAEKKAGKDIIHVLWDYGDKPDISSMKRIRRRGLDLWGAPGTKDEQVKRMREALLAVGGSGMVLTRWRPCVPESHDDLIEHLRRVGPLV